jgi:ketosteroid isomerase-like protein
VADPGSSPSSPVAVVERAYELLRSGSIDEWIAMWTEDIVIAQTEAVPWGGVFRGKEECREFLQRAGSEIASAAGPDEPLYASGDDVVAIGRSRGTARKTGKPFDIRIVHVWRVRGEQLASWTLHVDTGPLLTALERSGAE